MMVSHGNSITVLQELTAAKLKLSKRKSEKKFVANERYWQKQPNFKAGGIGARDEPTTYDPNCSELLQLRASSQENSIRRAPLSQ